jgi:hypothetical protein
VVPPSPAPKAGSASTSRVNFGSFLFTFFAEKYKLKNVFVCVCYSIEWRVEKHRGLTG